MNRRLAIAGLIFAGTAFLACGLMGQGTVTGPALFLVVDGGNVSIDPNPPDSGDNDAGQPSDDDAGVTDFDGGEAPPSDAGQPTYDAGLPEFDAGHPGTDAGHPATDAGHPVVDAGHPAMDAGASMEDQVIALMNVQRAKGANCAGTVFGVTTPIAANAKLHASAQGHSVDMATHDYFDHNSQDGTTPWQRIAAAGYSAGYLGENIAAGQTTPASVVGAWMSDYGHCANIMSPHFQQVGVGYATSASSTYKVYWTQDFGGN